MNTKKYFNPQAILMLMAFTLSMFSSIPRVQAAFGTSPPWLKNDHLLPGSTFEQVIYLSRNEPDEEMKALIRIDGDKELAEWISIEDEENLVFKKGQTTFPMKVIVNVSQNTAIKEYRGGIYVTLSPLVTDPSLKNGEVAIGLGARISVDLLVIGQKITDYQINSVSSESQKEDAPFSINLGLQNNGNTEINQLEGQVEIYNDINTKVLKTLAFMPLDEPLSPDESKKIKMTFSDFKLDSGQYWVAIKAFNNEKVIYENCFLQEVTPKFGSTTSNPSDKPDSQQSTLAEINKEVANAPLVIGQVPDSKTAISATKNKVKNIAFIFGLAGLGLALIAIIGAITIFVIKKKEGNKPPEDYKIQ